MGGEVVNRAEYNDGCLNICGGDGGRTRVAALSYSAVLAPAALPDSLALLTLSLPPLIAVALIPSQIQKYSKYPHKST